MSFQRLSKCLPDEEPKPAEPKFKVGSKVRYVGDMQPTYKGKVFVIDGEVFFNDYYNQWQTRSIKPFAWDGLSVCNVPLSDLELYTDTSDAPDHFRDTTKMIDNIIQDGFRSHNRMHIAAMAMQGILGNADRMKQYGEIAMRESENLTLLVARNAMRYADALIAESEKKSES